MVAKIETAEEAVDAADRFVGKYHGTRVLQKVVREGAKWKLEFDVGILSIQIVRVTLDAETGSILEYTKAGLSER